MDSGEVVERWRERKRRTGQDRRTYPWCESVEVALRQAVGGRKKQARLSCAQTQLGGRLEGDLDGEEGPA